MMGWTCFGHYYAHHQELTTIVLITTWAVRFLGCVRVVFGVAGYRTSCYNLQPGHLSSLPAPNFHPTTQEPDSPCGNQHYSRELLMMCIIAPETCWAYHKCNKTISSIKFVLILQLSQRCTVQFTSNVIFRIQFYLRFTWLCSCSSNRDI